MPIPKGGRKVFMDNCDMNNAPTMASIVSAPREMDTTMNSTTPTMERRPGANTQTTGLVAKMPTQINLDMKKKFEGGRHKLPVKFHMGWKPNRNKRELDQLPKTDEEKYTEDIMHFTTDGQKAVIDNIEDLMMLGTSIPPPHYLFEQERYFIFPEGSDITWEDKVFVNCGNVKFEVPSGRFYEDPALGMDLWLTVLSITAGGMLSKMNAEFDIRGLRVTRKKSIVFEFWIGRKSPVEATEGVETPEMISITEQEMNDFQNAIRDLLEPTMKLDRFSNQRFEP